MSWRWLFLGLIFADVSIATQFETASRSGLCADLSGTYQFYGAWEKIELTGDTEIPPTYVPSNTPPRLDRFALRIFARQVSSPRAAVVSQDQKTGEIVVQILGAGIDSQMKESVPELPARISLQCENGRWLRKKSTDGGAEGSTFNITYRIFLDVTKDGELVAQGEQITVTGLIFKSRYSENWVAKFAREK